MPDDKRAEARTHEKATLLDLLTSFAKEVSGSDPVPFRIEIRTVGDREVTARVWPTYGSDWDGYFFRIQ